MADITDSNVPTLDSNHPHDPFNGEHLLNPNSNPFNPIEAIGRYPSGMLLFMQVVSGIHLPAVVEYKAKSIARELFDRREHTAKSLIEAWKKEPDLHHFAEEAGKLLLPFDNKKKIQLENGGL